MKFFLSPRAPRTRRAKPVKLWPNKQPRNHMISPRKYSQPFIASKDLTTENFYFYISIAPYCFSPSKFHSSKVESRAHQESTCLVFLTRGPSTRPLFARRKTSQINVTSPTQSSWDYSSGPILSVKYLLGRVHLREEWKDLKGSLKQAWRKNYTILAQTREDKNKVYRQFIG